MRAAGKAAGYGEPWRGIGGR